jgi:hypothetical protein
MIKGNSNVQVGSNSSLSGDENLSVGNDHDIVGDGVELIDPTTTSSMFPANPVNISQLISSIFSSYNLYNSPYNLQRLYDQGN